MTGNFYDGYLQHRKRDDKELQRCLGENFCDDILDAAEQLGFGTPWACRFDGDEI